ncbi:MAG: cyclic pyranopterin monophosphate synthase MoaC [Candidatus Electryonea clarkiae]|nr:cyclic pyranopterin monophosphate synthase MoaC [Candidatus Electryonea clarkiae]MDP8287787.1 cyclic pyranopterin monophosphate synthase MoaC [Candidatus Electryonea clarkiae]
MEKLSHLNSSGESKMVDISGKEKTLRIAVAEGTLIAGKDIMEVIRSGGVPKGNIYEVARIAGIMAAKQTSNLIPLCHPLPVDSIKIEFEPGDSTIRIKSTVSVTAKTGVEMEALTAVSVAALTLYDMLKALSKSMRIEGIRLLEKSGGKSGDYNVPIKNMKD